MCSRSANVAEAKGTLTLVPFRQPSALFCARPLAAPQSALCLLLDDVAFDLDDTDALLGAHPCGDELEEHQCVFSDDSNGNTMPKSTHLDSNLWQSNRAAVGLYLDAEDVISAWEAAEDARFGSTCFAADDTQQPGNGRRSARAHAARLVAASEAVAECCLPAGHGANGSPFQSKRFVPFARHLLHSRRAGVDLDALLFHAPGSPSISEDVPAAMRKGQQYQHGRKGGRVPTPTPPCAQRNMQEDGLTRLQRVKRYLEKRRCRDFITRVRYHVRKANAEGRPRFKGRFVKTVGVSGDAAEGVLVPSV